jgi:hypothetical protein
VQVTSTVGLSNWQYITNEGTVAPKDAWDAIRRYYTQLGTGSVAGISTMFMDTGAWAVLRARATSAHVCADTSIAQGYAAVLVPGDTAVLPFSGLYTGRDQIQNYHTALMQTMQFVTSTPLMVRGSLAAGCVRADQGGRGCRIRTQATSPTTALWPCSGSGPRSPCLPLGISLTPFSSLVVRSGLSNVAQVWFSVAAADYFQLTYSGGEVKIARLTRFFDTWNVTMAVTNFQAFPQFGTPLAQNINTMFPLVKALIALVASVLVAVSIIVVCMARGRGNAGPSASDSQRLRQRGVSMISVQD